MVNLYDLYTARTEASNEQGFRRSERGVAASLIGRLMRASIFSLERRRDCELAQTAVVMENGQRIIGRRNMGAPIPNTLGTI